MHQELARRPTIAWHQELEVQEEEQSPQVQEEEVDLQEVQELQEAPPIYHLHSETTTQPSGSEGLWRHEGQARVRRG